MKEIKFFIRDIIYKLTGRVTYKEALKIKEYARTSLTGRETIWIEDLQDLFPNQGITDKNVPSYLDGAIYDLLYNKARNYVRTRADVPSKYKAFLCNYINIFYGAFREDFDYRELDDGTEEEYIQYVILEYTTPSTKSLIGTNWKPSGGSYVI